ncbi:hypothetical protein EXIGLDRAFT_732608 [Exidia glandulosa HHB12029]|uniref:Transmembrane protein n=1 Tax=Exidia glandulosa HHB12029 TaxID=1314781 RepID=A0A165BGD5_EXIGL|nr:hypothetical protein EXIGLDRAFT_732608 [Exidia glandulosa HHB12029]
MSFITTASSRPDSTLSRTTSASTLESSPPLTPPESTLPKFWSESKTLCASPEPLDDARSLLPEGFTFPTLADVRAKAPYRDPFVNCRSSEEFRAVDALAAVHFAALKAQQTRESRLRVEREREGRKSKINEKEKEKTQRKMFEDAWMCAKGAMSVVLVSGGVLCVLALA